MKRKPVVAIVGRPNVGKSTFVNRLVGSRSSIVDDLPGVTRDRIYFDVEWQGKGFTVIDTGGIIPDDDSDIMNSIFSQAQLACEESDKIIFIVDGQEGINPIDYDIANILRRASKPVYLAVNKCDNPDSLAMTGDFYSLSVAEPVAISALHGSGGVGDLLDIVTEDFEYSEDENEEDKRIKIAIVGRPNAGKSSIINALLNTKRVIVSDVSGTTRDSIDSFIRYKDTDFTIIDTAGIRKKSKVDYGVEKFAVDRAIRSIRDCDVAVLVIDAKEGISDQDKRISSIITESGKGIIVAINKWDLIEDKKSNTINKFCEKLESDIPFLSFAPKIFISALTKQRIFQIFEEGIKVYNEANKRIATGLLNKVINEAYALNPPTSFKGKKLKIYYTTQVKSAPPTFIFFVNSEELLKDNYRRYLENKLREAFGFFGNPIRLSARERKAK